MPALSVPTETSTPRSSMVSNCFSDGKERILHQWNPMVKSVRVEYYREADTWTLRERAKAIQASSERAELAEAKECSEAAGVHASQRSA